MIVPATIAANASNVAEIAVQRARALRFFRV
jgi:hypothetical protein